MGLLIMVPTWWFEFCPEISLFASILPLHLHRLNFNSALSRVSGLQPQFGNHGLQNQGEQHLPQIGSKNRDCYIANYLVYLVSKSLADGLLLLRKGVPTHWD